MLSVCPSFLDSEQLEDTDVLEATADLLLENSGTLFAELLDPLHCHNSEEAPELQSDNMSVQSESEHDEIIGHLRKSKRKHVERNDTSKLTPCSVILSDINANIVDNGPDIGLCFATPVNNTTSKPESVSSRQDSDGSESPQTVESTSRKCMSRNAIHARANRLKKKEHLASLERDVEKLTWENASIKDKFDAQTKMVKLMQSEITYLRNVIANETGLSDLIKKFGTQFDSTIISEQKDNLNTKNRPEAENTNQCPSKKPIEPSLETKDNEGPGSDEDSDSEFTVYLNNSKRKCLYVSTATGFHKKAKLDEIQPSNSSYNVPLSPCASPETPAGVCLHVCKDKVSLELCSICASNVSANRWSVSGDHSYVKS